MVLCFRIMVIIALHRDNFPVCDGKTGIQEQLSAMRTNKKKKKHIAHIHHTNSEANWTKNNWKEKQNAHALWYFTKHIIFCVILLSKCTIIQCEYKLDDPAYVYSLPFFASHFLPSFSLRCVQCSISNDGITCVFVSKCMDTQS